MGSRWRIRSKVKQLDVPGLLQVDPAEVLASPRGWAEAFGRDAPLEVEIGPGKGEFLIEEARRRPEHDFVGIEVNRTRVKWIEYKVAKEGLRNVRLVLADAANLLGVVFPEGRVAACYLNFPDPWPKRRHARRRLIRGDVFDGLIRILAPGGLLTVVSDVGPFAAYGLELLEQRSGLVENVYGRGVILPELPGYPVTVHERKFRKVGRSIHFLRYRKLGPAAATSAYPVW